MITGGTGSFGNAVFNRFLRTDIGDVRNKSTLKYAMKGVDYIFHMEAGNRCKDECLPEETNRRIVDIISDVNMAYSEHARRYLAECGLPRERTYVTGSPMAEVLHNNLAEIEGSDVH